MYIWAQMECKCVYLLCVQSQNLWLTFWPTGSNAKKPQKNKQKTFSLIDSLQQLKYSSYYTVCIIVLVLYVILFVATEAFAH